MQTMTDINEILQQTKEEFKERAFERFLIKFKNQLLPVQDNKTAEMSLDIIELKPLYELFAHDVEVYGENAYLMWDVRLKINDSVITVKRNSQIKTILNDCLNNYSCLRKTSSALPFDLERAKNGDAITWINHDENNFVSCKFISQHDSWRALIEWNDKTRDLVAFVNLRMKYPPKVAR